MCVAAGAAHAANEYGKFEGDLEFRWNDDNRTMTLPKDFSYVDPLSVRWVAPKGSKIDGASIPQWAWSLIGGPFEGAYRKASVVHDVACDQRSRALGGSASRLLLRHACWRRGWRLGEDNVRSRLLGWPPLAYHTCRHQDR